MEWDTEQTKHLQVIKIGIKFFFFFQSAEGAHVPLAHGHFCPSSKIFPHQVGENFLVGPSELHHHFPLSPS